MPQTISNEHPLLTILCPSASCGKVIALQCPYCRRGGLLCDEKTFHLTCDVCQHSVKRMYCECGMHIQTSYILSRQKALKRLFFNNNGSKFLAALITMGSVALILSLFVILLG